jgi:hypothetical protein
MTLRGWRRTGDDAALDGVENDAEERTST